MNVEVATCDWCDQSSDAFCLAQLDEQNKLSGSGFPG